MLNLSLFWVMLSRLFVIQLCMDCLWKSCMSIRVVQRKMSFFNKAYFFSTGNRFWVRPIVPKEKPYSGFGPSYRRFYVHLKFALDWVHKAWVHMKSTIARAKPQKGFYLEDRETHSKLVSGGKKAFLKKLFFFWTALLDMSKENQKMKSSNM